MKYLDLTLPTPAENLACDEALLDAAESTGNSPNEVRPLKTRTSGGQPSLAASDGERAGVSGDLSVHGEHGEVLRFWESPKYFAVVGYANKVATEVNVPACEQRAIPILRRCTGGGTVLQGPGCLNYALVLRITDDGPTRNISTTNQFVMERNRATIESLLGRRVDACGHTDLAIGGIKFSGNSQRRRKHHLLFHGTFLLNFDIPLVSALLRMPTHQPDYRAHRTHEDFIANLNLPATAIKAALRQAWNAREQTTTIPAELIKQLVTNKYALPAWNFKF